MRRNRFEWWHGVAFYAGVQVAQWGIRVAVHRLNRQRGLTSREEDRAAYEAERLPVFAPPGVAFPIAWGINSISSIAGGLYVLNLSPRKDGRREFLCLQAGAWVLFALFSTAYFELKSPINAALVTAGYTGVTIASIHVAVRKMKEPRAALSLATTAAWLAIANPVAIAQVAWNRDLFWNVGPFAEPPERWVKVR
jgi:tryptophan-rich sensory protein